LGKEEGKSDSTMRACIIYTMYIVPLGCMEGYMDGAQQAQDRDFAGESSGEAIACETEYKCKENINIDPREIVWESIDWIQLAQERVRSRGGVLMNTVRYNRVTQKAR
jgi:hypothetical protein